MQRREFMRVAAVTGTVGFLIPGPASAFYDPKLGEPHTELPSLGGVRDLWALPVQPFIPEATQPEAKAVLVTANFEDLARTYGMQFHPSRKANEAHWLRIETLPVIITFAQRYEWEKILLTELLNLRAILTIVLGHSTKRWKHISAPTVTCDNIPEADSAEPALKLNVWLHVTTELGEETMSALMASAQAVATNAGVDDVDDYAQLLKDQASSVNEFLEHAGAPGEPCPANPDPNASADAQKAWVDAHSLKCFAGQATPRHKEKIAHHIKRQKRRSNKPVSEADAEKLANSLVNQAVTGDQASVAASLLESRGQQ